MSVTFRTVALTLSISFLLVLQLFSQSVAANSDIWRMDGKTHISLEFRKPQALPRIYGAEYSTLSSVLYWSASVPLSSSFTLLGELPIARLSESASPYT